MLKSAIAPDVLQNTGHDTPLTPQNHILFWNTIAILTITITILFIITLTNR